jgi:hypothetical protein
MNAIVEHFFGNVDEAQVGEDFVVVKDDGRMLGKEKTRKAEESRRNSQLLGQQQTGEASSQPFSLDGKTNNIKLGNS